MKNLPNELQEEHGTLSEPRSNHRDQSDEDLWNVSQCAQHLRIDPKDIDSFLKRNPDFPVIPMAGKKRIVRKFSPRRVLLWEDAKILGLSFREMLQSERRKELN